MGTDNNGVASVSTKLWLADDVAGVPIGETTELYIKKDVKPFAFQNCANAFAIVTFSKTDGSLSIGDQAFYNCKNLKRVKFGKSEVTISQEAFANCDNILLDAEFGEDIRVQDRAFYGSGKSNPGAIITGGGVSETFQKRLSYLGEQAFGYHPIQSFIGGESLSTIGTGVFTHASSLQQADFSKTQISVLPENCFYGCTNLKLVKLPANFNSGNQGQIDKNCFYDCDNLSEIWYYNTQEDWDTLIADNSDPNGDFGVVMPNNGVNVICTEGYLSLTLNGMGQITGSNNIGYYKLRDLGNGTFSAEGRDPWKENCTEVALPESNAIVSVAGYNDFVNLTSFTINSKLKYGGMDLRTFWNCSNLETIDYSNYTLDDWVKATGSAKLDFGNIEPNTNLKIICSDGYCNSDQDRFYNYPFVFNENVLTGHKGYLSGPYSVSLEEYGLVAPFDIGEDALSGSVQGSIGDFSTEDEVGTIGKYAFKEQPTLTSAVFGNINTIGDQAFYNCTNLSTFECGNVDTIEDYAFYGCTNLSTFSIKGLEYLGESVFTGCTSFGSVLKDVGDCFKCLPIFYGNKYALISLTDDIYEGEIDLSKYNISVIGDWVFDWGIYDGRTFLLGSLLTGIGPHAFNEYNVTIKYDGTKEEWGKVKKGEKWAGTGTRIECRDGTIDIDGNEV